MKNKFAWRSQNGPFARMNRERIVKRGRKPLTLEQFGEVMGCSGPQVTRYNSGEQEPSYIKIIKLVRWGKKYGVTHLYLDKIFSELHRIG